MLFLLLKTINGFYNTQNTIQTPSCGVQSPIRSACFLNLHPNLLLLSCLLICIRYPGFFSVPQICQDRSYLKAFSVGLKNSFHIGFLLAGSWFKCHLFKKGGVASPLTHVPLHIIWLIICLTVITVWNCHVLIC